MVETTELERLSDLLADIDTDDLLHHQDLLLDWVSGIRNQFPPLKEIVEAPEDDDTHNFDSLIY